MLGKHEHHIWIEAHNGILQISQKCSPTWEAKSSGELIDPQVFESFHESLQDPGNNVHNKSIAIRKHRNFIFQECYLIDQ